MIHYPIPPHKKKCYGGWKGMCLPVTEQIHREELSIPLNQTLTEEETGNIVGLLNNFK